MSYSTGFESRQQGLDYEKQFAKESGLPHVGGAGGPIDAGLISVKNASGQSTQVHLTTFEALIRKLNPPAEVTDFLRRWSGDKNESSGRRRLSKFSKQELEDAVRWLNSVKKPLVNRFFEHSGSKAEIVHWREKKTGKVHERSTEDILADMNLSTWELGAGYGSFALVHPTRDRLAHFQRKGSGKDQKNSALFHLYLNAIK